MTMHRRACHLCEAICGLVITVEESAIVSIKGDPDDPLSRGHICPKAVALQDIHNDPDRLRGPMRRLRDKGDGDRFEAIDWETALNTVAERIVAVRQRYGDDAFAVYMGNPSVHNYGVMTHQGALFSQLRTKNRYSATSVDQLPHHLVSLWLYGHKDLLPVPDIDNTDYFLMLGANPIASKGSIWTVPDVGRRISDLKRRGGKLVVLDPRHTETTAVASEYHGIRPGSDVLFLAAMLNTLFTESLTKPDRLVELTEGLDEVRDAVVSFTPEAVASATGIAAPAIRAIARDFATAEAAVCYGRMGVSVQAFGTLNHWLIQMINIVTGNLDRVGGTLFARPALNDFAKTRPGRFDRFRSRVSNKPEFDGELPVTVLAEEILTPGDKQVKALFTCAGNPVLSTPNGRRLDEALAELSFMVSLDPYINETTRHADIILPPTSPLEHDHYDLAFHAMSVRNTVRFNEAVFPKPEGALHDWEIFTQLGQRVATLLGTEARPQSPPAELVDGLLRAGNYSEASGHPAALTLDVLRDHPSGIDLGPLEPSLPERLLSENRRIRCDVPECLADLARARAAMAPVGGLLLIGRRQVRSNNSWMHNYRRLVKGKDRCTLLIHPEDMAERGIADGATVRISSRVGSVEVAATASNDMMPGVVCLPHGYGHQRDGVRLAVASALPGASLNDLTDECADDPLSGNAVLNGVPVEVTAVNEPTGARSAPTVTPAETV
ncbi:MAG TPA: molybdopterin oxidoreductase family protein [Gammaproteobacteria bacterium]|nr:molybdopterin oxidoreductase family protein [Gammaproteobacteria bacterium]